MPHTPALQETRQICPQTLKTPMWLVRVGFVGSDKIAGPTLGML